MASGSLTGSPVWTCFRLDFQRRWQERTLRKAALIVVGILLVQGLVTWAAIQPVVGRSSSAGYLLTFLANLGLLSPFVPFPNGTVFGLSPGDPRLVTWMLLWAAANAAIFFLLPAYAAQSIAPAREERRIHELILAGLTPRQILLAKGLAAVAPFLVLELVAVVANLIFDVLIRWPAMERYFQQPSQPGVIWAGTPPTPVPEAWWLSPFWKLWLPAFATPLGFVALVGILVCLSALCRRTHTALIACYGTMLLKSFLLGSLLMAVFRLALPAAPHLHPALRTITALLVQWGVFLLLARLALRSLAYPDDTEPERKPERGPAPPRVSLADLPIE
jgi:hypothetical protein